MRSQNSLFEKIPLELELSLCRQKKALLPEPKSVWDCSGDITFGDIDTPRNNHPLSVVLSCVCLFVNNKEAHNEKIFS